MAGRMVGNARFIRKLLRNFKDLGCDNGGEEGIRTLETSFLV